MGVAYRDADFGLEKNLHEARRFLALSAEQGNVSAVADLEELA